ncbi:hypothetical protein LTR37_007683 [Vermiconidia calcicola]|uniref:Uncharacterized protein n=1 Tax=Vermiconidia calcicola TaxID=1690605 RepID=A0ACC3NE25_9PEZI|nr:hypothetical protein LTR37_007683 [Vermiconidia calcicola]
MKLTTTLSLALAALASAVPTDQTSFTGVARLATYDDLKAVPGISQINPVGTYKGLVYRSFNVLQPGVLGAVVVGLKPQSSKNVAANSITASILTGSPALTPAPPFKSFILHSVFFGCVANTVSSVATVPQQCTVAFTAYKPGSSVPFGTINQQFDPTGPVLSSLNKATFPESWGKVGKISVAIVQATTTSTLTGLFLDDAQYTLY